MDIPDGPALRWLKEVFHKPYTCPHCSSRFHEERELEDHLAAQHPTGWQKNKWGWLYVGDINLKGTGKHG